MAKAHYLQDANGNKFYPYGHANAIYDENGNIVGDILKTIPKVWSGTKAECDAAIEAGTIAVGTYVYITDDYTRNDITSDEIEEAIADDRF